MRRLLAALKRLGGWCSRGRREHDLQDEFAAHLQMHIDDNLRAGMSPTEARREAALKFGSRDSAREAVRGQWTVAWLENTRQDIVYSFRALRRTPGFALAAILSLALGIGASVAIFAVADGVLLRPLPYWDPDGLFMVWEVNPYRQNATHNVISPDNFRDWRAQNQVFQQLEFFGYGVLVLNDGDRAEEFVSEHVSKGLLPMLGVQPWRGRLFANANPLPQRPDEVLISYRLWQSWFGGDESVIGRRLQLSNDPATIIGILPPNFYFRNRQADLWEAYDLERAHKNRGDGGRYMLSVGRLKPGVSHQEAQAEMSVIAARLDAAYPDFNKGWGINVEPLRESMVRDVKQSLFILLGAVFLLLAVACATVANLLLARHASRRREMAVRAAIGAGRRRIARQLLTESLMLALAGGALGIFAARWAVRGLILLAPQDLARNNSVVLDLRIVVFASILSMGSAVAFGLIPAFTASRRDPLNGLREAGRAFVGGHRTARQWLVGLEVALSILLLAGAGLLFRTLVGLQSVDPGLNPDRVLTFRVTLPRSGYQDYSRRLQFFHRAIEEVRALPGVQSVGSISSLPFHGLPSATSLTIAGRPPMRPGQKLVTIVRIVQPGYFHAMGIPLERGRDFTESDNTLERPYRFIISRSFARQYFAGEEPLGKQISVNMTDKNPFGEIVGIAGDVREDSLDKEAAPTVYYIHGQLPTLSMYFIVRAAGDPLSLAAPLRRVFHELSPLQPLAEMDTMQNIVRETFSRQTFSALLLGGFSLVSLLLAAVGIYGVLAYSVTERTREFGVRVALGANPGSILSLVLSAAARIVLAGTAAGIAGALALTNLLRSLLFSVAPRDTATFVAVPLVLVVVALMAAWIPARRAARLAPVDALRED